MDQSVINVERGFVSFRFGETIVDDFVDADR